MEGPGEEREEERGRAREGEREGDLNRPGEIKKEQQNQTTSRRTKKVQEGTRSTNAKISRGFTLRTTLPPADKQTFRRIRSYCDA
jgi:hypothetical protein